MGNTTSKSKPAASQSSVAKTSISKYESKSSEAKPVPVKQTAIPRPILFTTMPPCRLTDIKDTSVHIGSFLNARDLAILCRASSSTQLVFSKQLHEKALLNAVFDANPEEVQKILKLPRPKSKCIVLTKTHIQETYFRKPWYFRGIKRVWKNISPLEAAAWCGDIFLVRDLLLHVPESQKLEACNQLKGILDRKESEENGAFLAPYRALIHAYEVYNGQFNALYTARNLDELDKLRNEVWQRQRLLPTYGLQEYCDDKSFTHPPRSFTEPPKRSCYLFDDPKTPLDLDDMKFGYALFKAWVGGWFWSGVAAMGGQGPESLSCRDTRDADAIIRLCELRIKELGNIIKELEEPKLLEESEFEEDRHDKDIRNRP